MGLIIQQRALQAAGGLRHVLPVVRKRDRSLFDQIHRAMNSVVLNIAEADGNDAGDGEGSIRVRPAARPRRCEPGFSSSWPTGTSPSRRSSGGHRAR